MPRLLIINITRNQGSTGKIAEQTGLLMKQRRWEVFLAHGARFLSTSALETYQIQSVRGEYLHALKSMLLDADGLGSAAATKRLVEYIKRIKPDVIHIHNLHGYYVNYKILFAYLNTTSIQVVITMHDCWYLTGHCVHFVTASCDKWRSGCGSCPQIHSVPRSLFVDNSAKNHRLKRQLIAANKHLTIVCVSRWLEQYVRQSMYKDHDIRLIHNGIDLNMFRPAASVHNERVRILGIGNPWSKAKGLYDIFKLRTLLPETDYEIVLVGLSPKQLKVLPEGITGLPPTYDQQELAGIYSHSDIFVNPTYADTFPTTNIEAMASGLPVVTYRTGGSPETISPDTGIVVEQGDVEALAAAVKSLRERPIPREQCRRRAEMLYNKDERFADYVSLYESLIHN